MMGIINLSGGSAMKWTENRFKNSADAEKSTAYFSREEMRKVKRFHVSMPQYEPTKLHELPGRARSFGIDALYVKDESTRFGLKAFKGLGVSYAMARYFAGKFNLEAGALSFHELLEEAGKRPGETFATATEGNHGKGVAWGAGIFNQKGKVFLPEGAKKIRVEAVTGLGAEAEVTDMNYDDTVQYAADEAEKNGWILMQDTAWEGYTEIPADIMRGYTTVISEIESQLDHKAFEKITHVVLQAGVGSFAGAMAAALYNITDGKPPKIIVVEPEAADPIFRSAESESGGPVRIHGDMDTVMAGLSCGAPSPIGWEILKSTTDCFVSCDDEVSEKGMRLLGGPAGEDPSIVSGASGALPFGFLAEVMTDDVYSDLKEFLGLGDASRVLVISTEGDTDPDHHQRVMKR